MKTCWVIHHDGTREHLWWILALVVLAAILLLSPGSRLTEQFQDLPKQGSATADYRSWRPTGLFAQ